MLRPTSVTVFAIINIVFALWGGLGIVATAVLFYTGFYDEALQAMPQTAVSRGLNVFGLSAGLLGAVALLTSGIGMLSLRPWARQLAVVYAVLTIALTIVMAILNGLFVVRPMFAEPSDDPAMTGARIGAVIGLFASGIGLIYPALLWFFMSRPHVVAAFSGIAPPQPNLEYVPAGAAMPPRDPTNPYTAPHADLGTPGGYSSSATVVETLIPTGNKPALLSYYLGLFSLFPVVGFFLGVAAVYLGIQGLKLSRRHPEVRGGTHAWVGLICGGLFGTFNFLLLILVVLGLIVLMLDKR